MAQRSVSGLRTRRQSLEADIHSARLRGSKNLRADAKAKEYNQRIHDEYQIEWLRGENVKTLGAWMRKYDEGIVQTSRKDAITMIERLQRILNQMSHLRYEALSSSVSSTDRCELLTSCVGWVEITSKMMDENAELGALSKKHLEQLRNAEDDEFLAKYMESLNDTVWLNPDPDVLKIVYEPCSIL